MKKFALVSAVLLLSTGLVFATPGSNDTPTAPASVNDSVIVTAALQGYLSLINLTPSTTFLLDASGSNDKTVSVATANVATNLKNWKMVVTAASATGSDTSALVSTDGNAYRIPYKLLLAGSSGTITDWTAAYVPAAGLSESYHNRVTNGTTGETITMSVIYGPEDTASWFAGLTYTDTVTVTLSAL